MSLFLRWDREGRLNGSAVQEATLMGSRAAEAARHVRMAIAFGLRP